jgi:anti-sigma factor RsiW
MNCRHIRKRLTAYQDGEIGGEERNRISAHLEGCPACRSFYAEMDRLWQEMGEIPEVEVTQGFERSLLAKIHTAPAPRSWWSFPSIFVVHRWIPAPAVALGLMLMGVALGGYLGNVLVSSSRSVPGWGVSSQNSEDIYSFKVFAAVPPGSLGEGYLRMASFTEDSRK